MPEQPDAPGPTPNEPPPGGPVPAGDGAEAIRPPLSKSFIQLVLIPLGIVGVVIGLFVGIKWFFSDVQSVDQLLVDIREGSGQRRWQAAVELQRVMANEEYPPADREALTTKLIALFREPELDGPTRQYVALALGGTGSPAAVGPLTEALQGCDAATRIHIVQAIGKIARARAAHPGVPEAFAAAGTIEALSQQAEDPDFAVRKVACFALGLTEDPAGRPVLRGHLNDPEADVRWNAALALARVQDPACADVLRQMLDRAFLEKVQARNDQGEMAPMDPGRVEDVMLQALSGVFVLGDRTFRPELEKISKTDPSVSVQRKAMDVMYAMDHPEEASGQR